MKFKLTKKKVIWTIIILLVLGGIAYFVFGRPKSVANIQTAAVTRQNLQETVLATGQVVSGTNLDLSFQGGGVVTKVAVKEGNTATKGMVLATLDQSQAWANLTTAQGSFLQAKANYEKLVTGATQQTIQTSQDAINSAKQNLNNAYSGAINTLNNAYTSIYNAYNVAVLMLNNYFTTKDPEGIAASNAQSDIDANMKSAQSYLNTALKSMTPTDVDAATAKMVSVLNAVYNDVVIIRAQCDLETYYYNVKAADKSNLDTQKTAVNTSLTSVTALQQNVASLELSLKTAEDQLSVTTAPPTQADIDSAKAQILSAQGQVNAAQAALNNLTLTAPEDGTITSVNIKVGEQATAMKEVMVLQNVNDLHAEAYVSEANIASMSVGQPIDYTFDALGPDQHFPGTILTINPASTVISGVVNYLVKGTLDNVPGIKPGMTANFTVLVAKKDNALAVPSTAVINSNNNYYVRVIDNPKTKTYHQVQVQEGIQADGGLIEIVSGLKEGQEIITYMQ